MITPKKRLWARTSPLKNKDKNNLKHDVTETPSLTFHYSFVVFFSEYVFHLKFFGNSFTANVVLVAKSTTKKTSEGEGIHYYHRHWEGAPCTVVMLVRKGISPQEAWMFL